MIDSKIYKMKLKYGMEGDWFDACLKKIRATVVSIVECLFTSTLD